MNGPFVDICDLALLQQLLEKLTPDTSPQWGRLSAQTMVEHLATATEYTNGQKTAELEVTATEAAQRKKMVVRPETVIPQNIQGPLTGAAQHQRCKDLPAAIEDFLHQVALFHRYYEVPGRTAIHPSFGPLTHEEWVMWHGKHFAHHFTQFGLL